MQNANDPPIDKAFDEYIAWMPPLAPWLLSRTGRSFVSDCDKMPRLPPDADDRPSLASDIVDGLLTGVSGEFYRPVPTLVGGDDPAFSFKVTQTGEPSAEDGGIFNRAVMTLALRATPNAQVAHIVKGDPTLRRVPDLALLPTLVVPVTREDGSSASEAVVGDLVPVDPDGNVVATFRLSGTLVEAVFLQLSLRGQLSIAAQIRYSAYQLAVPHVDPTDAAGLPGEYAGRTFEMLGNGTPAGGFWIPVPPPVRPYRYYPVTAGVTHTLALGLAFATNAHRARFTVTAGGMTRPIVDDDDLHDYAGPRSQYRELASIADVAAKYPSLQRLYLGQVSGTVVAVPAAYGILRTRAGLAARCDAIVDDSPAALTGSRFHFTFDVGPIVDPVDLARLQLDVAAIPEAANRGLTVLLPGGLDARNPATLDGWVASAARFADGPGNAVEVAVDIADTDATPATLNVGLFLSQLASAAPGPLFGNLAVRLDDDYPQPVRSALVLNLHCSAQGDELDVVPDPAQPTATVTNAGPLDLRLRRSIAVAGGQATVVDLGALPLAAGQSTVLAAAVGASFAVSRELALATPVPRADLLRYLTFNTQTVQQVQHPLTINAAAIAFAEAGITAIVAQFALVDAPAVAIAPLTLTATHPLDYTHALIPVASAITGLRATVALTLQSATGARTLAIAHDFVDEPIFVLTPGALA